MTEPTYITREEFHAALKIAKKRRDHKFPLRNGWFVKVERIYPQPARVGPAWHFVFYLESPTGKTFGGRTSMAEMIGFFCNPNRWTWTDAYATAMPETIAEHMKMRYEGGV
jgi:hypothetical protein